MIRTRHAASRAVRRIVRFAILPTVLAVTIAGLTAATSEAATGVTVTLPTTQCSTGVVNYAAATAVGNAYLTAAQGRTFTWTTTAEAYYSGAWHKIAQGANRTENGGGGARSDLYNIGTAYNGYYVRVVFWIWDYQYAHWVGYPGNYCQIRYIS
jgi:hypothetical protein